MADIGAAEERDAAARAPVAGDPLGIGAEGAIVRRHIADPSEPDPRDPLEMRGDMEEQPVDRVKMLGHLLDPDLMAGKIGHQRRAAKHRQRHQVERRHRHGAGRRRRLAGQEAQRPHQRRLAALAPPIRHHRPMHRAADAGAIEPAQQIAHVRIAEEGLAPRHVPHAGDRRLGDPVRPIAAAREPHRPGARIIGAIEQRGEPQPVAAGEMPLAGEALLVEGEFDAGRGERDGAGRIVAGDRSGGGADGYADHGACLEQENRPHHPSSRT